MGWILRSRLWWAELSKTIFWPNFVDQVTWHDMWNEFAFSLSSTGFPRTPWTPRSCRSQGRLGKSNAITLKDVHTAGMLHYDIAYVCFQWSRLKCRNFVVYRFKLVKDLAFLQNRREFSWFQWQLCHKINNKFSSGVPILLKKFRHCLVTICQKKNTVLMHAAVTHNANSAHACKQHKPFLVCAFKLWIKLVFLQIEATSL